MIRQLVQAVRVGKASGEVSEVLVLIAEIERLEAIEERLNKLTSQDVAAEKEVLKEIKL